MARTYVNLDSDPIYRAVVFELYPGVHDLELKTYTDQGGNEHQYHRVSVNGPYSSKGTATAQVNRLLRDHEWRLEKNYRGGGNYYTNSIPGTVPEVKGLVEVVRPLWYLVDGTEKTA